MIALDTCNISDIMTSDTIRKMHLCDKNVCHRDNVYSTLQYNTRNVMPFGFAMHIVKSPSKPSLKRTESIIFSCVMKGKCFMICNMEYPHEILPLL
jgi:hypothetical protein